MAGYRHKNRRRRFKSRPVRKWHLLGEVDHTACGIDLRFHAVNVLAFNTPLIRVTCKRCLRKEMGS